VTIARHPISGSLTARNSSGTLSFVPRRKGVGGAILAANDPNIEGSRRVILDNDDIPAVIEWLQGNYAQEVDCDHCNGKGKVMRKLAE
jgi:hypothetical protein